MGRVYGAADPNSGTASLIEVAKGLGTLYRDYGWRPTRTIYLLSWSGEEYGLLGSTGWGELNVDKIKRAIAYINVDTVVSGDKLEASASPSLTTLWKHVLKDLTSSNELERWNNVSGDDGPLINYDLVDSNTNWKWRNLVEGNVSSSSWAPQPGMLGSGSDYTVFLDHLGIPSLDFRFTTHTGTYGQYHSIYDSFDWMDQYGGGDNSGRSAFHLMEFASKIWGIMTIRLATSPLVPMDHIAQGVALEEYLKVLQDQPQVAQNLDLSQLTSSIESYQELAAALHLYCFNEGATEGVDSATGGDEPQTPPSLNEAVLVPDAGVCNEKLGLTERFFLMTNNEESDTERNSLGTDDGLPGRRWFKHILQAPGMDLGYAAEAFPGIQQAINDQNLSLAQDQVDIASQLLLTAANHLRIQE